MEPIDVPVKVESEPEMNRHERRKAAALARKAFKPRQWRGDWRIIQHKERSDEKG